MIALLSTNGLINTVPRGYRDERDDGNDHEGHGSLVFTGCGSRLNARSALEAGYTKRDAGGWLLVTSSSRSLGCWTSEGSVVFRVIPQNRDEEHK